MVYPQQREQQLRTALQRLGLPANAPVNLTLLNLAFTHPSANHQENYEKLEFMGDAVIRLLASEVLMQEYPDAPVGDHAAIRSILVSDRVLAQWGERYGFDRYLLTAQRRNGLNQKFVRLADIFEAVLGALYSSTRDMSLIEDWLTPLLREQAAEIHADPAFYNYKDALQEWTQGQHQLLPDYRVQEQSKDVVAAERFRAEAWLKEDCLGTGVGPTKKAAEQAAAKAAFVTVVQPHNVAAQSDKA